MNSGDALFENPENAQGPESFEIYADRVEIINPGGLPKGLTPKAFGKISIRRNELVADLFYRLRKVERIGMGIKNMKNLMKSMGHDEPRFEMNGFFRVVFNRPDQFISKVTDKVTDNQKQILAEMINEPPITTAKLSEIIGISQRKIKSNIAELKRKGLLSRHGSPKDGYWEVME